MTREDGDDHGVRDDTDDTADGDAFGDRDDRDESVVAAIEAGAALFNAGHVLAARGLWESTRSAVADREEADADSNVDADPDADREDDRVLRGLAAVATAADRVRDGDRPAAADHGTRAVNRLEGVGGAYRGLALEPVREWCRRLAAGSGAADVARDPIDDDPPALRVDGVEVGFEDLGLAATLSAAPALAAAVDAGDEGTLSAAARLAREERGTGRTRVTELVFAYLRRPEARPQIAARIADHVDRDRREQRDVSGLFE